MTMTTENFNITDGDNPTDNARGMTLEVPAQETGPDAPETKAQDEPSVEAMKAELEALKAELNKLKTPDTQEEGDKESEESEEETKTNELEEEAGAILKVAGLDVKPFADEFAKNGGLSEDSYKKLEEAGFPKAVVDQYIAGAKANTVLSQQKEAEIKGLVGGNDAYTEMVRWAKDNLTAEEIQAYDRIMHSGDEEAIRFAVTGLKARFSADGGKAPSLVSGRSPAGTRPLNSFRSSHEVVEAMRDPRYGKDAAYTREVEARLAQSNVF